jgi:hypothetical protein
MSQPPTPYSRQYNFAGWSVSNPTTPHQGNKLDQEYNALLSSVNATISRLGEIQDDQGAIRMNEGTAAALAAGSAAVLASGAAAAVAAAAAGSHTHTIAQVTSLQTSLDAKATTTALTAGLATKANTTHTHAMSDVTGLSTAISSGLATKADVSHAHLVADITGLVSALAAKLESTSQQVAKAWVSFDGTTTPPLIKSSYNVSSVTRSATGVYVVNFTNAFSDANYCWTTSVRGPAAIPAYAFQNTPSNIQSTTQMSIVTSNASGNISCPLINVAVYR